MPPKMERIKDFIKKIDTKIAKLQKQRHTAARELADLEMAEAQPVKKKRNRNLAHEWRQSVHSDNRSTCWECENCGMEVWTKKDDIPNDPGPCEG